MTFMMTSSSDDKVTFVKFVIKTYSILSIQYMYKISYKMDINFLRYSMFFSPRAYYFPPVLKFSEKSSAQVGLSKNLEHLTVHQMFDYFPD